MDPSGSVTLPEPGAGSGATWSGIPDRLRARGLRWTPQRRVLVEVLSRTGGHVTGSELVERCRELDPGTIPSTVYRTLDVLEELGVLSHSHGADGREEFHVLPESEHGHLICRRCGAQWELAADDPAVIASVDAFAGQRGFAVDVSHMTMIGLCAACQSAAGPASASPESAAALDDPTR
jgi:Fur family transcriptional regulator, ferric uptake regulator